VADYTFKLDGLHRRHTKTEIVASLKRYAEQHPDDLVSTRAYDSWRHRLVSTRTISEIFGSWGKALQAAGLRSQRTSKLHLREMVKAFKACWEELDSPPSRKQLEAYLEKYKYPFRWASYREAYGGHVKLAKMIIDVQEGRIAESTLYKRVKPAPDREKVPPKLRVAVLKRDHNRCVKCGADPKRDRSVRLEVDHIIPDSKKGQTVMENLQTLCFRCNRGKSNDDD
jgi:hypothetical protein